MLREWWRERAGTSLVFVALLAPGTWALEHSAVAQETPEFVSASELDSSIVLDMRYATANNFVGTPIDGYAEPVCLLTREAAEALVTASSIVRRKGYRLVAFDCYRPQRAVDHFVRWSHYLLDQSTKEAYYPNVDKRRLFAEGYIASRSGHSRASTVDVGLARACDSSDDGYAFLDMGTPFDFFDPLSHTDSPGISDQQRRNRRILVDAMREAGFRNYAREWWHFTLQEEPFPGTYFDVVVEARRR